MGKFIKQLLILTAMGLICLTIYAYMAPLFGVSFDPIRNISRVPVILDES